MPRCNSEIESMEGNMNQIEKRSIACGSSEDDSVGEGGHAPPQWRECGVPLKNRF